MAFEVYEGYEGLGRFIGNVCRKRLSKTRQWDARILVRGARTLIGGARILMRGARILVRGARTLMGGARILIRMQKVKTLYESTSRNHCLRYFVPIDNTLF